MKRLAFAALSILLLLAGLPALAGVGPCPETSTSTKVESGDLDGIVLEAGISFCVKAGEENSGTITADGTTSLSGYVTWLNNGGQKPEVSHYVTYPATTSTTSSTTSTTGSTTTTTIEETTTTHQTEQPTTTTAPLSSTTSEVVTTTAPVPTTTTTATPLSGPPTEELPYTGFDPGLLFGLALALGSSGLFLLDRSRRTD